MMIERAGTEEYIQKLIPFLHKNVQEGLITMENVKVIS